MRTGATEKSARNTKRRFRRWWEKTDTVLAPWTIVAAESKRFARIKVLETVIQRVEAALG